MEMEMAKDPFLEAGIAIPAELPYQDESQRENSARLVVGKGHQRHESLSCEPLQKEDTESEETTSPDNVCILIFVKL